MSRRSKFVQNSCYHQSTEYKAKIRERDNYTCQTCGGKLGEYGIRQLDVAHIIPFAVSKDSSPDNLRCLCHSCNRRENPPQRNALLPIDAWWEYIERLAQELPV